MTAARNIVIALAIIIAALLAAAAIVAGTAEKPLRSSGETVGVMAAAKPAKLPAPSLTASAANETDAALSWSAVPGADAYAVYLLSPGESEYTKLGGTTETDYIKTGLTAGKRYKFRVAAVSIVSGKAKTGELSNTVEITLAEPAKIAEPPLSPEQAEAKYAPVLTEIANSFASSYGTVTLGFTDFSSGYTYISSDEDMFAASSIKVYVMDYVYLQIAAGTAKLSDTTEGFSLQNDLEAMITVSDNAATGRLLKHFGFADVSARINEKYPHTVLNHWGGQGNTKILNNFANISDTLLFLRNLYDNRDAFPANAMISTMKRQQLLTKIPKYIREMPGVAVANKTGSFNYLYGGDYCVTNDMAIVFTPGGDFALAFYADGVPLGSDYNVSDLMARGAEKITKAVMNQHETD